MGLLNSLHSKILSFYFYFIVNMASTNKDTSSLESSSFESRKHPKMK